MLYINTASETQVILILHSISLSFLITPCLSSPVQGVEGFFAALHVAFKWLLLCVNPDMDFEAVRGQEGLPAALLVAHERVLSPVGLLVSAQVPRCAVRPRTAFKHALVALHLMRRTGGWKGRWQLGK